MDAFFKEQDAKRVADGLPGPQLQALDPVYEAQADEHDRLDHIMWLNGFTSAVWEVSRAELRAAPIVNLRHIAEGIFDLDADGMSRTRIIDFILAHKGEYEW